MDNTDTNATPATPPEGDGAADGTEGLGEPSVRPGNRKRRRGSRGGRNRKRPTQPGEAGEHIEDVVRAVEEAAATRVG